MRQTIEKIAHDSCSGCGACLNKCPKDAIIMEYDAEGFLFPKVTDACIDCGACLKACPVEHPVEHHQTPETYAVMASDELRMKSSSGGMFSLMADVILQQGGAVCGAAYAGDFMTVHHQWAEKPEDLVPLRGSKYVQSDTRLTYRQAKKYLDQGRPVLYTGCPCQIAGLYSYLGKTYENLYTADLVCHGSNSATAYQSFLKEFTEGKKIEKVDFRDKKHFGWASSTVAYLKDGTVKKQSFDNNAWYNGFLEGVFNRENCSKCPYARTERVADITLGDCWQVHRLDPALDDRKGTSLVLVNSEQGKALFKAAKKQMKKCESVPLEEVRKYNGQLNWPAPAHRSRKFFFEHLPKDGYHKALWYGRGLRFDVGLVGWWFASNYGSCLTYYALGRFLEELGKQIILVKLPTMSGAQWDADTRISMDFLSRFFKVSGDRSFSRMPEVNHFCDAFMLGSDQMWRQDSLRLVGYSFFLDFVSKNKKKIAFSTSFGNEHFTDDSEIQATVRDFLQRFDAISVREKSGIDVCKREFGVEAQQILDPVFFCKREDYDRMTETVKDDLPEKYLLCYILDPTEEKERAAQEIAKQQGLQILTILGMKEYAGAVKRWHTGTVLPKVTPEQFVNYIKNCDYLLTDSHHGTCFGIIYHKPYAAVVNSGRGATRFETVAHSLGLQKRLFFGTEDIFKTKRPYQSIDYAAVDKCIAREKERARIWLEEAWNKPAKVNEDTLRTLRVDMDRKLTAVGQLQWQVDRRTEEIVQLRKELEELRRSINDPVKTEKTE